MSTSGTYSFNPSIADLSIAAFARIQIRPPAILASHMADAQREANFTMVSFSNRGPNLWAVDQQSVSLVAGTATYSVLPETVMILNAYITITSGGQPIDTWITALSRDEYAALPNKTSQGMPTTFWFDRLTSPSITLWLVPDSTQPYTLNYWRYRQLQDASVKSGQTADLQYLFLDAFVADLSWRLARIYNPDLEDKRKADAIEAWEIAAMQNVENVNMYIAPGLGSYYR